MALTKATQNVLEGIVSTGSTGVSAGSFIVVQQYKITSLGTTTQSQWNTIAGTTGQTYVVGSMFTAATTGASSGTGAAAVARTLANRFADVVNVLDFGAVGDGVADDTTAIQAAVNSLPSIGGKIVFPNGKYLVNDKITITKDNVTIDFGSAIITNTVQIPSSAWEGQTVSPLFFFNSNNGVILNGHFENCVSQGVLVGGTLSNNKIGFYISGTKFTNLVSTQSESKCVQARHVDNIIFDGIVCKNIGVTNATEYTPTLSINYSTNAIISNCIVDDDKEGGAANFLYVNNGSINNCQFVNITNTSGTQNILGIHVKFSNQIEITGNTVKVAGGSMKISEDVNNVTITGNYLETNDNAPFAGVYLQGPSKLTFTSNVVICNTNRAIYISPHTGLPSPTDPVDIIISNNYIRGNYNATTELNTTPTTYGSGIQINGGLLANPRGPIMVSNNLFANCDLWMFQTTKSTIKGNFFQIDIDMYNNTLTFAGSALSLSGGQAIWAESFQNGVISDNVISITQITPSSNQIVLRLNSTTGSIISNNVGRFFATSTSTFDYVAETSTSNMRWQNNSSFFAANTNYYKPSANQYIGCDNTPDATTPGIAFIHDGTNSIDAYFSSSTTSGDSLLRFINPNGLVGSIATSGTGTTYNTASDYRLKESVQPLNNGLNRVLALNPVTYTWKTDGINGEGFIAHELAEICPDAVTGKKDAVDVNGNPEYQSIDASRLVCVLVCAIKELKNEVNQLKESKSL